MRIKELKLQGFKSFVDRTSIKFDDNYIGIVGPNGSGKSNIIDAIRWVFGEQSNKNLRGNSSTDIIFGGTINRKKVNLAEVTLVLDNSDNYLDIPNSDVSITRRLYRTGNSEYLINNNACRLKDISDLIVDSGIGKSSFSIISQGKIESIIMDNPDNRRTIIEEVAGVLKYKNRKTSTVKKLEKTDENLEKVNLILHEMTERIKPLEEQAKNAKIFKEAKEELEQIEIDYLANKISQLNETYQLIQEELTELEVMNVELETKQTNNYLIEQEYQIKINNYNAKINETKSEILDLQKQINEKETNFQILREREKLVNSSEQKVVRMLEIQENQRQLQKVHQQLEIEQSELQIEIAQKKNKIEDQESQNSKIRMKAKEIQMTIYQLENELGRYSLPLATQKILDSELPGIIGSIGQLFKVSEEYAKAIDIAIGGRINEIVVNSRQEAIKAINYLKENKFGRQTFLPLKDVQSGSVDQILREKLKGENGYIGVAIDLIEFDPTNNAAFANLLANILIVKDLESGTQLKNKYKINKRIVTLTGDVINVTGTLTGGDFKRKSKLSLESELKKNQEKLKNLANSNDNDEILIQEYNSLSSQYALNQSKLNSYVKETQLLNAELENYQQEANSRPSQEKLEQEAKIIEESNKTLAEEMTKSVEFEGELKEIKEEIENLRYQEKEASATIQANAKEITKKSIDKAKIEGELKNSLEILRQEYNLTFEFAYKKANKEINLNDTLKVLNELKRKIRSLGNVNLLAIEEYEKLVERHNFIDEQKKDLLIAKEKLEKIINKLDVFFIETFEETYVKLREEFQKVFTELFGGGSADLVLTNTDDYLTTGVEIVAQPPGKKLQTISLLSGGEKALTAISLLFAILRIRPVPFAILDEVEAALDEANVKRYAKYLEIFSERTQFMVITHRQGTMEAVKKLYGVTMQEKGVSTIIDVRLKKGGLDV